MWEIKNICTENMVFKTEDFEDSMQVKIWGNTKSDNATTNASIASEGSRVVQYQLIIYYPIFSWTTYLLF